MSERTKKLFFNNKFKEITKMHLNHKDGEDMMCLVLCYEELGDLDTAIKTYYTYREIIEDYDLINGSKILLFLLASLKKEDQIQIEKEHFLSMPYFNQETEEYLKSIDQYIKKVKKFHQTTIVSTNEGITKFKQRLWADDYSEKEAAIIQLMSKEEVDNRYVEIVAEYLNRPHNLDLFHFTLLEFLALQKYDGGIYLFNNGKYYYYEPFKYRRILLEAEGYLKKVVNSFKGDMKNPSVYDYFSFLVKPTYLFFIPEKLSKNTLDKLIYACFLAACETYGVNPKEENCFKDVSYDQKDLEKFNKIIAIIKSQT